MKSIYLSVLYIQLIFGPNRVFLYDDKVLPVNTLIASITGWPSNPKLNPHPLAKLVRRCFIPLNYFRQQSKEAITAITQCIKQRILHPVSELAKRTFTFTLTLFKGIKRDLWRTSRRLKHIFFNNTNSIPEDPELGSNSNRISERKLDEALSEAVSEVDRAVNSFIDSLDKEFAVQYHQPHFRTVINQWKSGM